MSWTTITSAMARFPPQTAPLRANKEQPQGKAQPKKPAPASTSVLPAATRFAEECFDNRPAGLLPDSGDSTREIPPASGCCPRTPESGKRRETGGCRADTGYRGILLEE